LSEGLIVSVSTVMLHKRSGSAHDTTDSAWWIWQLNEMSSGNGKLQDIGMSGETGLGLEKVSRALCCATEKLKPRFRRRSFACEICTLPFWNLLYASSKMGHAQWVTMSMARKLLSLGRWLKDKVKREWCNKNMYYIYWTSIVHVWCWKSGSLAREHSVLISWLIRRIVKQKESHSPIYLRDPDHSLPTKSRTHLICCNCWTILAAMVCACSLSRQVHSGRPFDCSLTQCM
jgi:hypothetical protein